MFSDSRPGRKTRSGFTALEILLAITIACVLGEAVFLQIRGARERAYIATIKSVIHRYTPTRKKVEEPPAAPQYVQSRDSGTFGEYNYSTDSTKPDSADLPPADSDTSFAETPEPATMIAAYPWTTSTDPAAAIAQIASQYVRKQAPPSALDQNEKLFGSISLLPAADPTPAPVKESPIGPHISMDADPGVGRVDGEADSLVDGTMRMQKSCGPRCHLVAESVRFDATGSTGPIDLYTLRIDRIENGTLVAVATTTGKSRRWTLLRPRPGVYRATMTAQDARGVQSPAATASFNIGTPPVATNTTDNGHLRLTLKNNGDTSLPGDPTIVQAGHVVDLTATVRDRTSTLFVSADGRHQADHAPWISRIVSSDGQQSGPYQSDFLSPDSLGADTVTWDKIFSSPGLYTITYTVKDARGSGTVNLNVLVTP